MSRCHLTPYRVASLSGLTVHPFFKHHLGLSTTPSMAYLRICYIYFLISLIKLKIIYIIRWILVCLVKILFSSVIIKFGNQSVVIGRNKAADFMQFIVYSKIILKVENYWCLWKTGNNCLHVNPTYMSVIHFSWREVLCWFAAVSASSLFRHKTKDHTKMLLDGCIWRQWTAGVVTLVPSGSVLLIRDWIRLTGKP